jgi:hypothetical protein
MAVIETTLAQQLLASIESDRLAIFVGAGLSMSPPSAVPSAAKVARDTSEKFRQVTLTNTPIGTDSNLETLTEFFLSNNNLVSLFINRLVDWEPFRRAYNKGHKAVADFLMEPCY